MEQKLAISKTAAIIVGLMFLIMGGVAFLVKLNVVGSIILVGIGLLLVGIIGGVIGKFEEKDGT